MAAPSPRYRQVALATAVATFLLIVLGGIVRVSGSGLGCGPANSGFSGWPLCRGDVIPGLDLNAVIEYLHRVAAGAVGLMLLGLAIVAWRRYRSHRALVRATVAAVVLVVAQGLLGAATVEENLDERLVATHLALAMLLLALTAYIWRASRPSVIGAPAVEGGPGYRALAASGLLAVFLTIVAGGYMAGTQNYGRPDYQLGDGAHHACGKEFPTCNGEFLPFGEARLVDIHLTHRVFVYIAALLVIALVVLTIRRRPTEGQVRAAKVLLGLLVVQILVGALNVWLDEYEALIVLHLALGAALWGHLSGMSMRLYPVPAPRTDAPPAPASQPAEALTA